MKKTRLLTVIVFAILFQGCVSDMIGMNESSIMKKYNSRDYGRISNGQTIEINEINKERASVALVRESIYAIDEARTIGKRVVRDIKNIR
jgi:hypothetical protein